MARILAIGPGKCGSVARGYDTTTQAHRFTTIRTTPWAMRDRVGGRSPGLGGR